MPLYPSVPGSQHLPRPRFAGQLLALLHGIAFWIAVLLVGLYPVALFHPALATPTSVAALLGVHAVALVAGYPYEPA
jgi:hypothetical protein